MWVRPGAGANSTALAGHIFPALEKFSVNQEEAEAITKSILAVATWQDISVILFVGWAIVPFFHYVFLCLSGKTTFRETRFFLVVDNVARLAKIALLVYMVDVLNIVLPIMGFEFAKETNLSRPFAKVAYTIWAATRFHAYKRYILHKYVGEKKNRHGLAQTLNHLMSGIIGGLTAFVLIDILDVELGFTLKSAFAFGSAGTIAFTLASQGLVSQLVHGLALTCSTNVFEGELVKFGDGTTGQVRHIGWIQTWLRGSDDHVITIPNSQLASQKVHNMSRERMCQVKQLLRFHYKDAEKLPALMEDMKEEIKASCPEVITDGTRQFRIVWTNYMDDHLQVLVDVHFWLPAIGDLYWNNRQQVMLAILRAVKKHKMTFAIRKYALAKIDED